MVSYKIGEIEAITGIKAHTIRVWEKRYDLLLPNRSATDMRKYSEEDLRYLLTVAILNKSGYKISKISKFTEHQLEKVVNDEDLYEDLTNLTDKLIIHIIDLNQNEFINAIEQSIAKHGLDLTFKDLIVPFLNKIGNMWQYGALPTAKEFIATNLIRQILMCYVSSLKLNSKAKKSIILFLPEHELHDIELLFYYHKLRNLNYKTYYLGQNLPYHTLSEFIQRTNCTCLITNWVASVDERNIFNYFKKLKKDWPNLEVYAGGNQVAKYEESLKPNIIPITRENYLEIFNILALK